MLLINKYLFNKEAIVIIVSDVAENPSAAADAAA